MQIKGRRDKSRPPSALRGGTKTKPAAWRVFDLVVGASVSLMGRCQGAGGARQDHAPAKALFVVKSVYCERRT